MELNKSKIHPRVLKYGERKKMEICTKVGNLVTKHRNKNEINNLGIAT
jgi:hypothetical protein